MQIRVHRSLLLPRIKRGAMIMNLTIMIGLMAHGIQIPKGA